MFPIEGRFVIRPKENGQGDVVIGAMFKSQTGNLRPGRVYEIKNILGEPTIVDVGPAAIGETLKDTDVGVSWANDLSSIVNYAGGTLVMTRQEYKNLNE